jgi:pseudouridylate synthase
MNTLLQFSAEVKNAMQNNLPVVALESTIISHGMPYPHNLEVATEVENTVRKNGAVPATIAILNGQFHVGLSEQELDFFAQAKNVMKCSRRDLPFVVAQKLNGATTVAATMIIAEMAGIPLFATGGIGGVHRHAETTFDISADLIEFAQTPVAVVSAGAKAILDLPKTMEYLETFGVPVIGYGTDFFPAFYSTKSDIKVPMRLNQPAEIAQFIKANQLLSQKGILIANPIPAQHAIDNGEIEQHITKALQEAQKQGIAGKETTPFLLKKLNELTAGKSQVANKALVLNNAELAAKIAVELKRQ